MMEDFVKLCSDIGLKTTKIKEGGLGRFNLYIKPLYKFYNLYNQLSKKFPLINLNYKEERMKKALEIKKQKPPSRKNILAIKKSLILESLKNNPSTINSLTVRLLLPPRTIRRYIDTYIA